MPGDIYRNLTVNFDGYLPLIMIRSAALDDASAICGIYNYYIENSVITFEEQSVSPDAMQNRMQMILHSLPWLVYEENNRVTGYAFASEWKGRCAYRHTVESTIYLEHKMKGRGIGSQLYTALLHELRKYKMHSVIGGIALPNPASVALHEKLGFKKVAQFKEVGWKFNRWIDVGYWELLL